jgi:hypothetical protein
MVDDDRTWKLGRLVLRRGTGLDPAALVGFFAVLEFVGTACREIRSETVHIENLAAAGCIAATSSLFKIICAVNGGAVRSTGQTSIEISDAIFISAWSSAPALSRLEAASETWVPAG